MIFTSVIEVGNWPGINEGFVSECTGDGIDSLAGINTCMREDTHTAPTRPNGLAPSIFGSQLKMVVWFGKLRCVAWRCTRVG